MNTNLITLFSSIVDISMTLSTNINSLGLKVIHSLVSCKLRCNIDRIFKTHLLFSFYIKHEF